LEQFVDREKATGFHDLILPLYYIQCAELQTEFAKRTDSLARVVAGHSYKDIRMIRNRNLDSRETREAIQELATQLIERFSRFSKRHLSSTKMEARIAAPAPHARVPHTTVILGTLRNVSAWIDVRLVVETGALYHPQRRISPGALSWQTTVSVGRSQAGLDASHEFLIHVLAVTEEVGDRFERYRTDSAKRKEWHGVPKPLESKVLATVRIVRDDSASMFRFMENKYDECTLSETTGAVIRMKVNGPDSLITEGVNPSGKTEWTGNVKMAAFPNSIRGEGTYQYFGEN
jgi:hypothetical protein